MSLSQWQWQNNIEMQLYNIKQACTGDQRTADTYIALFTHRNFHFRLKEVNDLILANFTNTPTSPTGSHSMIEPKLRRKAGTLWLTTGY